MLNQNPIPFARLVIASTLTLLSALSQAAWAQQPAPAPLSFKNLKAELIVAPTEYGDEVFSLTLREGANEQALTEAIECVVTKDPKDKSVITFISCEDDSRNSDGILLELKVARDSSGTYQATLRRAWNSGMTGNPPGDETQVFEQMILQKAQAGTPIQLSAQALGQASVEAPLSHPSALEFKRTLTIRAEDLMLQTTGSAEAFVAGMVSTPAGARELLGKDYVEGMKSKATSIDCKESVVFIENEDPNDESSCFHAGYTCAVTLNLTPIQTP